MIQKPPSLIALISFAATVTFAIIALGITGALCNPFVWNYCASQGTVASGPAIGIVASIFGALFAALGITWLIFEILWNTKIVQYVLMGGLTFVTVFAFISGVILAWTANNLPVGASYNTAGAGSAFQFFLMLSAGFCTGLVFFVRRNDPQTTTTPTPTAPQPETTV